MRPSMRPLGNCVFLLYLCRNRSFNHCPLASLLGGKIHETYNHIPADMWMWGTSVCFNVSFALYRKPTNILWILNFGSWMHHKVLRSNFWLNQRWILTCFCLNIIHITYIMLAGSMAFFSPLLKCLYVWSNYSDLTRPGTLNGGFGREILYFREI